MGIVAFRLNYSTQFKIKRICFKYVTYWLAVLKTDLISFNA